jgi:hypothetical protein
MLALARRIVTDLTGLAARLGPGGRGRPAAERWIVAASLSGWVYLLADDRGGGLAQLCSGAGWIGRLAGEWRAGLFARQMTGCVAMAFAMSVAMMLPLTLDNLRFVALRSFAWRRGRALGAWLAGYLGVWIAMASAISLALTAVASPAGRPLVAAIAFFAAALWQLTPAKRWALRACHRTRPLEPTGPAADASCLGFGARIGLACVVGCGPMMLAAMAAPWPTFALAGVFAVALYERYVWRPPTRATVLAFAAASGLLALQAIG